MAAPSFVRNSLLNAVAGVLVMLGGFLGTVIAARLLGVQGIGIVAFATWVVTMTMIVSDLGLTGCLPRFLPELLAGGDTETAQRLTWKLFNSYYACITAVSVCILAYGAWLLFRYPDANAWEVTPDHYIKSTSFWLLVAFGGLMQGLASFTTCLLKGLQDFSLLMRLAVASCVVQTIATFLAAWFFGITGALAALAAGGIAPAFLLVRRLRATHGHLPSELRRRVTRFSLETWGTYMLTAFFASRMEVFFLERSWGSHSVGLFTVSLTLANLATQGPLLLTGALLPRLSSHIGRNEPHVAREVYATSIGMMAMLVFPACLGTAAIAPVLLPLLYGHDFTPAVPTAMILLCCAALSATATVATVYFIAVERTRFLLGTALAGAALSILAGLTIVPAFGPMAAACGRGGVQVAIAAGTLLYMHRHLDCPTPAGVLLKFLAAAGLCAVAAHLVVIAIPNGAGVVVAILTGAAIYAAAIRLLRPLPEADVAKLRTVVSTLPRPLRPAAHAGLQLICS